MILPQLYTFFEWKSCWDFGTDHTAGQRSSGIGFSVAVHTQADEQTKRENKHQVLQELPQAIEPSKLEHYFWAVSYFTICSVLTRVFSNNFSTSKPVNCF